MEFERKLSVKDSDLNEEKVKARLLEEKLADKETRITDLTTENDMVHESLSRVEETLATKGKQFADLLTAKEACDRIIEEKETERINSYEELYQKEKELESAMNTIKSLRKQLNSEEKVKEPDIQEVAELKAKNEILKQKLDLYQCEWRFDQVLTTQWLRITHFPPNQVPEDDFWMKILYAVMLLFGRKSVFPIYSHLCSNFYYIRKGSLAGYEAPLPEGCI